MFSPGTGDKTRPQIRAAAEQERRRRRREQRSPYEKYRLDPVGYTRDILGWEPWAGSTELAEVGAPDAPGQVEVFDAYRLALAQQLEQRKYEAGIPHNVEVWTPGQIIKNRIRVEAGHTVGKTKAASALVNHFFDCFRPSIIYTYAPTFEQVHDLLWKEIKADRRDKGLPGRILDLGLVVDDKHFAKGRATSNAGGRGTERAQGQHGEYLMFVLDEAEGVADFVWSAVDSMTSGGISIVLMLANPRTRTSRFHKVAGLPTVQSFRISCLAHPNVLAGREIIPGAVRREWVEAMLDEHCDVVPAHDPDRATFQVPWRPGTVYCPNAEFMFRVLGMAPPNDSEDTFVPVGRYEGARRRLSPLHDVDVAVATIGVDVARWGTDMGTVYVCHAGRVWRASQLAQLSTTTYVGRIKDAARRLHASGVRRLFVRVDGGGGFGAGVVDGLLADSELAGRFDELVVSEVHFNGLPVDETAYADRVTELYAEAAEALRWLALVDPPEALEADLTERRYTWVVRKGMAVKKLESKTDAPGGRKGFRSRVGRSPDDGDGFVLAVAPLYHDLAEGEVVEAMDVIDEIDGGGW